MNKITFTKMVASGNDFAVMESSRRLQAAGYRSLARKICERRYGAGADGLLILEKSKVADIKMRIFNADGSEAEMCGNGARAAAFYTGRGLSPALSAVKKRPAARKGGVKIETRAGIIESQAIIDKAGPALHGLTKARVRIKLTKPRDYRPGMPIRVNGRQLKINSLNTGVPQAVIFVEGIDDIDVSNIGRQIRYYECFAPRGTNVNFVEAINKNTIKVRTYERGVEDETLACGTGAAAAAIVYRLQPQAAGRRPQAAGNKEKVNVITQGGETLKVYFDRKGDIAANVWLEGKVKIVYRGEYYV